MRHRDGAAAGQPKRPLREYIDQRLEGFLVRRELTRAERRVVFAIFNGRSTSEAAAARSRSVNTLKTQLRSIHKKLGVRDRQGLILKIIDEL